MLSPLVLLFIFCFNDNTLFVFPLSGFTLHWFEQLLARPQFWNAFWNSVVVTLCVGAISTVVGTLSALFLARQNSRVSSILMTSITLPVMVPPLMLGIALLSFYTSWMNMKLGLHTVILSHLIFTQPFVILVVYARMASFDYAIIESARDLGASVAYSFSTITLPIIGPSIVGAALIAMALSLDDFLVSFFTIGGGNTLPIFMWGMLRKGVDPTINVVAVILIALSFGASLVGLRITRYRG
jgi:spermidine/putrescine transport system permease protein